MCMTKKIKVAVTFCRIEQIRNRFAGCEVRYGLPLGCVWNASINFIKIRLKYLLMEIITKFTSPFEGTIHPLRNSRLDIDSLPSIARSLDGSLPSTYTV